MELLQDPAIVAILPRQDVVALFFTGIQAAGFHHCRDYWLIHDFLILIFNRYSRGRQRKNNFKKSGWLAILQRCESGNPGMSSMQL